MFLAKKTNLGRAQEFERGGRYLKLSVFRPKLSEEQQKKGQHFRRCSIFRPKSCEEQKKGHGVLRLSFIRISPLHHERLMDLSAGEGGADPAAPLDTPLLMSIFRQT